MKSNVFIPAYIAMGLVLLVAAVALCLFLIGSVRTRNYHQAALPSALPDAEEDTGSSDYDSLSNITVEELKKAKTGAKPANTSSALPEPEPDMQLPSINEIDDDDSPEADYDADFSIGADDNASALPDPSNSLPEPAEPESDAPSAGTIGRHARRIPLNDISNKKSSAIDNAENSIDSLMDGGLDRTNPFTEGFGN